MEESLVNDSKSYHFHESRKSPGRRQVYSLSYSFTEQRINAPSGLAVIRNYENALNKVVSTILQSDPERWVNSRIVKEGQEVWAQIDKGNGKIWPRIVEKRAMDQYTVADAAVFGNDIRSAVPAAVYGIPHQL